MQPANRTFLDSWLDAQGVPAASRMPFYNMTKEVRGKHALVAPAIVPKPAQFAETDHEASELIQSLNP